MKKYLVHVDTCHGFFVPLTMRKYGKEIEPGLKVSSKGFFLSIHDPQHSFKYY